MRTPFLTILITYSIAIFGLTFMEGKTSDGESYYMTIFDAFYFISYMATTIGFGATPPDFSSEQGMWVLSLLII